MFKQRSTNDPGGSKTKSGTEKQLSTQKKEKYAYIPDNFTSIEQVCLSLSLIILSEIKQRAYENFPFYLSVWKLIINFT